MNCPPGRAIPTKTTQANGIALKSSSGYPSFTVTPPAIPSGQQDIVVASAVNQTKGSGSGAVSLTFNHAMSKVAFSASYTGTLPGTGGWIKVKELQLKDMAKSGTLSLTSLGSSWSNVSSDLASYTLSSGDLVDVALPAYSSGSTGAKISSVRPPGSVPD